VGKRRRNSQYFKGKKLQRKFFNQLNIKKVKSTKIILKKKINKKKKKIWKKRKIILEKNRKKGKFGEKKMKKTKKQNKKEECTVDYYCNPHCIGYW